LNNTEIESFLTTLKYKVFEQHSNIKFLNNTQI